MGLLIKYRYTYKSSISFNSMAINAPVIDGNLKSNKKEFTKLAHIAKYVCMHHNLTSACDVIQIIYPQGKSQVHTRIRNPPLRSSRHDSLWNAKLQ